VHGQAILRRTLRATQIYKGRDIWVDVGFIPHLTGKSGLCNGARCAERERSGKRRGESMKALMWIAAGACVIAMAWTIGPDLRRYVKITMM
jgi:hypothetical protein